MRVGVLRAFQDQNLKSIFLTALSILGFLLRLPIIYDICDWHILEETAFTVSRLDHLIETLRRLKLIHFTLQLIEHNSFGCLWDISLRLIIFDLSIILYHMPILSIIHKWLLLFLNFLLIFKVLNYLVKILIFDHLRFFSRYRRLPLLTCFFHPLLKNVALKALAADVSAFEKSIGLFLLFRYHFKRLLNTFSRGKFLFYHPWIC